jgi:hypothetical protein
MQTKFNIGNRVWVLSRKFATDNRNHSASLMKRNTSVCINQITGPMEIVSIVINSNKIEYKFINNSSAYEEDIFADLQDVVNFINETGNETTINENINTVMENKDIIKKILDETPASKWVRNTDPKWDLEQPPELISARGKRKQKNN